MGRVLARIGLALALALGAAPAPARAAIGLWWHGCSADAYSNVLYFACDTNVGEPFVLFATVAPTYELTDLAAVSVTVDLTFWNQPVPPWWQTSAGQCRADAISLSVDAATLETNCPSLWQGYTPARTLFIPVVEPDSPNRLRLYALAMLPEGIQLHVPADGTELNICRLVISRALTVGPGSCGGRQACVFMQFVESRFHQPVGPLRVEGDNLGGVRNGPFWNGWCPPLDPVQNRSWGAIKGMYR